LLLTGSWTWFGSVPIRGTCWNRPLLEPLAKKAAANARDFGFMSQ
jgi:hypothetical protein